MEYRLKKKWKNAKVGELVTPHGRCKTPMFMPVGTLGSVKAVGSKILEDIGAQMVLGNTYHLYLRPGEELIDRAGGLHGFMQWPKALLTDSGGYQVSSLGSFREENETGGVKPTVVDDEGVTFWSHVDGTQHRLNAEKSIEVQHLIGADVVMAFDEATPDKGKEYAKLAMERTHRWLVRSKKRWLELEDDKEGKRIPQALFGIIQGGVYSDLRRLSAEFVIKQQLPGLAVGGGSIGQDPEVTEENVSWIRDLLPNNKPLYLMGVGVNPVDVIWAVLSGADMFDCVAPTRLARMGSLYSGRLDIRPSGELSHTWFVSEFKQGRLNIANARFKDDLGVVDGGCDCPTCSHGYSRAYLRHLFKNRELLYYQLASQHNLRFMIRLVDQVRKWILELGEDVDAKDVIEHKQDNAGND